MAPRGNGEGTEPGDEQPDDAVVTVTAADVREAFEKLCWGGARWQDDKAAEVQFVGRKDDEAVAEGEEEAAEGVRVSVRVRELELESALAESERRAAKAEAKAAALLTELGRGGGQHLPEALRASRNADKPPEDQVAPRPPPTPPVLLFLLLAGNQESPAAHAASDCAF